MDYQEFCRTIQEYLQNYIQDAEVSLKKILKINGIELISLNIIQEGMPYAPNIYMGPVYDFFRKKNLTIPEMADIIIDLHMGMMNDLDGVKASQFNIEDYEWVREHLTVHLVNRDLNRDLLDRSVSFPFLDLAGVFYIAEDVREMDLVIRVPDDLIDDWGVGLEELKQHALENLLQKGGFQMRNLCDVLETAHCEWNEKTKRNESKLYMLTDVSGKNGPAALLFPSLLAKFADELEDDLLLLPSSIHELVVVRASTADENELKRIIREINDAMVFPEEILGTSVYKYSREQSEVTIAA